jgi:hypothetical protein
MRTVNEFGQEINTSEAPAVEGVTFLSFNYATGQLTWGLSGENEYTVVAVARFPFEWEALDGITYPVGTVLPTGARIVFRGRGNSVSLDLGGTGNYYAIAYEFNGVQSRERYSRYRGEVTFLPEIPGENEAFQYTFNFNLA